MVDEKGQSQKTICLEQANPQKEKNRLMFAKVWENKDMGSDFYWVKSFFGG